MCCKSFLLLIRNDIKRRLKNAWYSLKENRLFSECRSSTKTAGQDVPCFGLLPRAYGYCSTMRVFTYKAPILWQWAAVRIHFSLIREPAHLQSISSAVLPYPNITCRSINGHHTYGTSDTTDGNSTFWGPTQVVSKFTASEWCHCGRSRW